MKTVLIIADGMGLADPREAGNAVTSDALPRLFAAMRRHGYATLEASGPAVGLDANQAGNSEVGHLTIGAGFVVPSMLTQIQRAYDDGSWKQNALWKEICAFPRLHVLGLLSDAGTHGHWMNLARAAELASAHGLDDIVVHPVLDGVDSQAGSAPGLLSALRAHLRGIARLGVVIGRTSFCDRSGNTELSRQFRNAVMGRADLPQFENEILARHLASRGEAKFPAHCHSPIDDVIGAGEPVLLTQNRADRAVQAAAALAETNPVFSLVELNDVVPKSRVFFPIKPLERGLPFELKKHNLASVRIAEACKFAHVTFFRLPRRAPSISLRSPAPPVTDRPRNASPLRTFAAQGKRPSAPRDRISSASRSSRVPSTISADPP